VTRISRLAMESGDRKVGLPAFPHRKKRDDRIQNLKTGKKNQNEKSVWTANEEKNHSALVFNRLR